MTAALTAWFAEHQRSLPWRRERSAYRVWLSEVMLQQTQVSRVVDYFERFVARFPTVQALAAADLDEVLGLWSGLGYYSRGRNLHRAAQAVVADHGGVFPSSSLALRTLPGVGAYTAAAVASFAGGERVAVVDGNVVRVVSRLVDEDRVVDVAAKDLEASAAAFVDAAADAAVHNEAMMELGALVCTPKAPGCGTCPLRPWCRAQQAGTALSRPVKAKKAPRKRVELVVVVVVVVGDDGLARTWLERRPGRGLFGGLWQPPTVEIDDDVGAADVFNRAIHGAWGRLMAERHVEVPTAKKTPIVVERTLTHRELRFWVTTTLAKTSPAPPPGTEGRLVDGDELKALGVSSAVMAILEATRSPSLF